MSSALWSSVGLLLVAVALATVGMRKRTAGRRYIWLSMLFYIASVFAAVYPMAHGEAQGTWARPIGVVLTLWSISQVFTASFDIKEAAGFFDGSGSSWGSLYVPILLLLSPVVTFGFVLSFFERLFWQVQLVTRPWKKVLIFTEMNERSLALARDARREEPKAAIIFTSVAATQSPAQAEYAAIAKEIGALQLPQDVLSLKPLRRFGAAEVSFFVMSDSEALNLDHAVQLCNSPLWRNRDRTHLYLFSNSEASEIALQQGRGALKVRRINVVRATIYEWLWRSDQNAKALSAATGSTDDGDVRVSRTRGMDIFQSASPDDDALTITAAVFGLGDSGTEMLRALSWFCQMDSADGPYRPRLLGVDIRPDAATVFSANFPGLVESFANKPGPREDAKLSVRILSGVDADTQSAPKLLRGYKPTFIYFATGDDERNLRLARRARRDYARMNRYPLILAHCRSVGALALTRTGNDPEGDRRKQIHLFGDVKDVYAWNVIVRSDLEQAGRLCHMRWVEHEEQAWLKGDADFWANEYFYRASLAAPIHWEARRELGLPGSDKCQGCRTDDESERLSRLEHARWSAFLRSEGFTRGDDKDLFVAKTHPLLRPYSELDGAEKRKDDNDFRDAFRMLSDSGDGSDDGRRADFVERLVTEAREELGMTRLSPCTCTKHECPKPAGQSTYLEAATRQADVARTITPVTSTVTSPGREDPHAKRRS